MSAGFIVPAVITLVSAAAAMVLRSLVHSALALAVAFAGLGLLFLNLNAQFLGLAQVLVYVGAIAVLIVFVIMLTRGAANDESPVSAERLPVTGLLIAGFLFAVLCWAVVHSSLFHDGAHSSMLPAPQTTTRQLGVALMQGYVLPLELIGLMLTAALIGAVIVAMKE